MSLMLAGAMQAQTVGNCQLGAASDTLDVGDVRAALYNTGGFFWRGSNNVYTVPKSGTASSIFAAGLWIGGRAPDGALRFAGTAFSPFEFWPGPLDDNGNPPDDCAGYDRLYSVYDADIRAYEANGALTDDLRDWPHHLGAPVVDGDGIAGNYDLAAGDRPHVYGEQSVWWVMNDVGNTKAWARTPPIGLEAQVQAFASTCVPDLSMTAPYDWIHRAVSQATYYHIQLIHRGQAPLSEAYIGWWTDGDLGNPADDLVGSDTTLGMGFYYNASDQDAGLNGYGDAPPAIGYALASGIRHARRDQANSSYPGFNHILYYTSDAMVTGNPTPTQADPYLYLQGRWRDGTPLTEGGIGYGGTVPVSASFPGDPVTRAYWSEENLDAQGTRTGGGDRRLLMSTGPIDIAPGDTLAFTVVVPWARGEDRLDSVRELRRAARISTSAAQNLMATGRASCAPPPEPEAPDPNALGYYLLRQNYPEPFDQQTTIRYEVINTVPIQLNVYDVLGRRVRTLVDGMQEAGVYDVVFEAGDLPTGTYFYRLEAAGYVSITRRMVLQR
ncbi:MAG: T9SS type A sorting domain-containing protein [Bacteroidota bacterium]